jgi:hypothetical protein
LYFIFCSGFGGGMGAKDALLLVDTLSWRQVHVAAAIQAGGSHAEQFATPCCLNVEFGTAGPGGSRASPCFTTNCILIDYTSMDFWGSLGTTGNAVARVQAL